MGCPDDEEFAALLSQGVDAQRRAEILDHAATCAACRSLIAALAGSDSAVLPRTGTEATIDSPEGAVEDDGAIRRAVASALFAHDRKSKIGRYQLLEIVGAGGMGVVWGAWDPELARRVALKLVHPRMSAARDRILAEGQALAKLSHPNVVPVYDVGVVEGQVYLVMEWIQGATLRVYAGSGCSQRELLDVYRQAGEGLAAVHRAGLVHRDFKPDNAIRGEDGRVRVLDFGLAYHDDADDENRRVAGTPRYMAPEQTAGAPITPAADQYAFAVSLREALQASSPVSGTTGTKPASPDALATVAPPPAGTRLPNWLARITDRGTAADPAARFPSMERLLDALARDPAKIWRRRAVGVAAVAAAVAAFVAGRSHAASPAAPTCTGSTAEIAESWNQAARAAMTAHLQQLGAFGAGEASRLGTELDAYGTTWVAEHHRACVAHDRGELPAALYERRIGCLARGKTALATVAELMVSVAADALSPALVAARSLPSTAACAAGDASVVPPPPAAITAQVTAVESAISRARVLAIAARPDAVAVARAATSAAEATGYAPLISRAELAQGLAEDALNEFELAARTSFERAVDHALRSGDDVTAVEAYARLLWAVGRYRGDIVDNWSAMEAIAARTGGPGRFGRSLLYNNKAAARIGSDDRAGARIMLQQALAVAPLDQLASNELELASIPQNLALVTDDPAEREVRAREVVEQNQAILGLNHPNTLGARMSAATLTRNPIAAAAEFQAACDGYQRSHPQLVFLLVDCSYERGWLADDRHDTATATAALTIAATDPISPDLRHSAAAIAAVKRAETEQVAGNVRITGAVAAGYLRVTAGTELRDTASTMEELAKIMARQRAWWGRGQAADGYLVAARGWDRLGQPRDAERCWTAALGLLERIHQPLFERRLARVRAILAQRWARGRPDDSRRLADAAIAWYRAAGDYDAELAELAPLASPVP